jgi:hypothetical protein
MLTLFEQSDLPYKPYYFLRNIVLTLASVSGAAALRATL